MFERFTDQARLVVVQAQGHARRLGHGYIGCEHLLIAVAGSDAPAGGVLRGLGVTPEAVEQILGSGAPAAIDRDALAVLGIDLDVVRERVEATFGPGALTRTMPPRRRRRLLRRRRCTTGPPTGHIPFTPRAKKCLERSLREAVARHDNYIGSEHLALALAGMTDGIAPRILDRLGVKPALARTAILDRYRKAG
jgi:ATP-dependent Clp protease ATP-binding subunit ClpA